VGRGGNITLSNKKYSSKKQNVEIPKEPEAQITLIRSDKNPDKYLCVWNVHFGYTVFSDEIDNRVKKDLKDFEVWCKKPNSNINPDDVEHIFGGDFNSNFGALHDKRGFNCTSVAIHQNNGIQKCFSPDGFIYISTDTKNNISYKQIDITHISTNQSISFYSNILLENHCNKFSELEKKEAARFKTIICLDDTFNTKKLIGNQTIYSYENYLTRVLNNSSVIVRAARNLYNDSAVCVGFKLNDIRKGSNFNESQFLLERMMVYIQDYININHSDDGFQFYRETSGSTLDGNTSGEALLSMYAPKGKEVILHNAIQYALPIAMCEDKLRQLLFSNGFSKKLAKHTGLTELKNYPNNDFLDKFLNICVNKNALGNGHQAFFKYLGRDSDIQELYVLGRKIKKNISTGNFHSLERFLDNELDIYGDRTERPSASEVNGTYFGLK